MHNECAWPQQCWKSCGNGSNIVALRFAITEQKKCWELSEKFDRFQTLCNNTQQHPTTCNRVSKQTQHVTSNNVASVCTGLNAGTPECRSTHSIGLFNCCCFCVRVNRTPKIRIRKRKTENRKENGKLERKQKIKISKVKRESWKRTTEDNRNKISKYQKKTGHRKPKTQNGKRINGT